MIFIITKNDIILNISKSIDNVYYIILSYIRLLVDLGKEQLNILDDLKITEYVNNCPTNSFKIDINTFNILDMNNIKIKINNLILENSRIELLEKINNTEINVFIPLDSINNMDTDMGIYIRSNTVNKEKEQDIKIKEDEILKLKQKIELEKQKLEEKNNNYDKLLTKLLEDKHKSGLIESRLKIKKEREDEKKRIFKADQIIYNCIIDEIKNQTRDQDDIPDLFYNKFIIIKKLYEDENYINYDDLEQFEKYVQLVKDMNLNNQLIKTKYDDMFDNIIYNNSENSESENENDTEE